MLRFDLVGAMWYCGSMSTRYTKEVLEEAVAASKSYAGVLRFLGLRQAGGTQSHISSKIKSFGIDTSHFTGVLWSKGRTDLPKKSTKDILLVLPEGSRRPKRNQLLRAMEEKGLTYSCSLCYNDGTWLGEALTLEIDHVDGNWLNNKIENLRFLCPNCHAQQVNTNRPHKYRNQAGVGHFGEPVDLGSTSRNNSVAGSTPVSCTCGAKITRKASKCVKCEYASRKGRPGRARIDWPSNEELQRMVSQSNFLAVGRTLGVSDNAVRKRLKVR